MNNKLGNPREKTAPARKQPTRSNEQRGVVQSNDYKRPQSIELVQPRRTGGPGGGGSEKTGKK